MKKSQLIINIVLILGLVILFVLYFTNKSGLDTGNNSEKTEQDSLKTDNLKKSNNIAYINVDTLLRKYKFYDKLEAKLLNRQKQLESQLNSKMAKFQNDVNEFQKKVQLGSFLSQQSAQSQQDELAMRQQKLMKLKDDLSLQLAQETQNMNNQLLDTVINYLKIYNKDKKYQYILNSASFLIGNPANDITNEIVKGLNKRYEKQNVKAEDSNGK